MLFIGLSDVSAGANKIEDINENMQISIENVLLKLKLTAIYVGKIKKIIDRIKH